MGDLPGLAHEPSGDQRFDALYEVVTENTRLAQDVLNGPMRDWLLANDHNGFRIVGSDVVIVKTTPISSKKIEVQSAQLTGILERSPASVRGEGSFHPPGRGRSRRWCLVAILLARDGETACQGTVILPRHSD